MVLCRTVFPDTEKNMLLYSSGFDTNKYYLKLLYKSTKDTDDITVFQNKVHNKKNIFIIILTLDNKNGKSSIIKILQMWITAAHKS